MAVRLSEEKQHHDCLQFHCYLKKSLTNFFIRSQFSGPTDDDESMTTTKSFKANGGHGAEKQEKTKKKITNNIQVSNRMMFISIQINCLLQKFQTFVSVYRVQ